MLINLDKLGDPCGFQWLSTLHGNPNQAWSRQFFYQVVHLLGLRLPACEVALGSFTRSRVQGQTPKNLSEVQTTLPESTAPYQAL